MKKVFLILILNSGILFAQSASFDPSIQIESQVDTTSFKIGEKIDYSIKISLKNKYDIKFSEKPNFLPFEVLESFESDTICLLYTSPSPRDLSTSRMPSSA